MLEPTLTTKAYDGCDGGLEWRLERGSCCGDYFYIPIPLKEPQVLDVEGGYKPLGWYDMEAEHLNYEGDSEKDDDRDDEEGDEDCDENNTQFSEVPIVEEESIDGDDSITQDCIDGFEGYCARHIYAKENRSLKMIAAGKMEYELLGANGGYAVKLREYNCQCGSWQVSGIPYCHAMTAISHYCGRAAVKDKVAEFVHISLTKSAYMQTYVGMIHPILDQKRWLEVPACILIPGHTEHMNPPPRTVQHGRPNKQRKREPDNAPEVRRFGTVPLLYGEPPPRNGPNMVPTRLPQCEKQSEAEPVEHYDSSARLGSIGLRGGRKDLSRRAKHIHSYPFDKCSNLELKQILDGQARKRSGSGYRL
ncbi:hypothetical protein LWI28_026251 [Acer negundo]|uniref:Zinc finger PMZ-type domain-containing protein n=1 Tax=Acer negundo TaxID=4023 RepID=A0AAD5NHI9_ACENE|nr:hypothetical protein LWI28_026251 [Acer negundo]